MKFSKFYLGKMIEEKQSNEGLLGTIFILMGYLRWGRGDKLREFSQSTLERSIFGVRSLGRFFPWQTLKDQPPWKGLDIGNNDTTRPIIRTCQLEWRHALTNYSLHFRYLSWGLAYSIPISPLDTICQDK